MLLHSVVVRLFFTYGESMPPNIGSLSYLCLFQSYKHLDETWYQDAE